MPQWASSRRRSWEKTLGRRRDRMLNPNPFQHALVKLDSVRRASCIFRNLLGSAPHNQQPPRRGQDTVALLAALRRTTDYPGNWASHRILVDEMIVKAQFSRKARPALFGNSNGGLIRGGDD